MAIELVRPGDCLVCFIRTQATPDGDIGVTFLAGVLHANRGAQEVKRLVETMCPKHAQNWRDMNLVVQIRSKI